jgi:PAS domain S-box-containing protein
MRYVFALLANAAVLAVWMLFLRWTGNGAPFLLFFGAVLVSTVLWGRGPGVLCSIVAAPIAAYVGVYQAGYTLAQALAQSLVFVALCSIVCVWADPFTRLTRRSEHYEHAARRAEAQIEQCQQMLTHANAALEKSEADLRQAQRLAHVGSWSWHVKSNTRMWSPEMYRIYGLDPGLPPPSAFGWYERLFKPESMARLRAALDKALSEGTPYDLDLELIRPDGTHMWVTARAEPIRDDSGKIVGVYGTLQDVTQLRRLLQMKDEWTSVIAHDLRQSIGSIVMSAEALLLQSSDSMTDTDKGRIERIRRSAWGLARMVDDLLDVSQMEAERLQLDRKWIDLRAIVRTTIDDLAMVAGGLHVAVSASDDLSPVFADPVRIQQVLGNLLSNAMKYGDRQSEIVVRLDQYRHQVEVSVSNRGRGIPADELSRLFDRFTRSRATERSGTPGLGLGLYIAKGLVQAHGGRIWVESIPQDTTTFHFTLPVHLQG